MHLRGLIVLLYLITAPALAVAQNMPRAAGAMVICAHGQVQTVLVDAHGAPIEAPHACADCLAQALDDLLEPAARTGTFPPIGMFTGLWHVPAIVSSQVSITFRARAPPPSLMT